MSQKMTLTAYLSRRGVKAKALTRGEAELLGISYPLQGGWPKKHGAIEIDEEMLKRLSAYAEVARQAADEKARRNRAKLQATRTVHAQLPLASIPPRALNSPVSSFVIRQAKRYRGRKQDPWS